MASFNRTDYRRVYEIGLSLYTEFKEFPDTAALARELIDMAESCIGQQVESHVLHEDE
jgi:hypothetical protein